MLGDAIRREGYRGGLISREGGKDEKREGNKDRGRGRETETNTEKDRDRMKIHKEQWS